jgi:hypothetical protein
MVKQSFDITYFLLLKIETLFIVLNEVSIMLYCILYGSDKKKTLTFSQDIFHNSIERIMINVQIKPTKLP